MLRAANGLAIPNFDCLELNVELCGPGCGILVVKDPIRGMPIRQFYRHIPFKEYKEMKQHIHQVLEAQIIQE